MSALRPRPAATISRSSLAGKLLDLTDGSGRVSAERGIGRQGALAIAPMNHARWARLRQEVLSRAAALLPL
jgi:hypothetical protein